MVDTRPFDSIPFVPRGRDYSGADCWGLVWLVARDAFGMTLPDYPGAGVTDGAIDHKAVVRKVESELSRYDCVDDPREGDVVVVTTKKRPIHVGIVVNRKPLTMLHTEAGIGPMTERLNGKLWGNRVAGYYRFRG